MEFKHKLNTNESAVVSIDLMVAFVLVMVAVMMALLILPAVSHEDRDWRLKQYMTAVRASDSLVKDEGAPLDWDMMWNSTPPDYKDVTKIGLVDDNSLPNVLNLAKITNLSGQTYKGGTLQLMWWEFPSSTTSEEARANATRALGLTGYNFYMQLHPVGFNTTEFDPTLLNTNLRLVPINNETATVIDRYVYIGNVSGGGCEYICYHNATLNKDISVHYRLNLWVWQ